MARVVCAVDETGSAEAVDAAVDFGLEHGAELRFVGVVSERFSDSTRGGAGERVRRRKGVKAALKRAAAVAGAAGVPSTATIRVGRLERELVAEADAVGASELFFVRTRSWLGAAATGAPRREPVRISLAPPLVRQLAAAA